MDKMKKKASVGVAKPMPKFDVGKQGGQSKEEEAMAEPVRERERFGCTSAEKGG